MRFLPLLLALAPSCACSSLPPAKQAQLDLFECQAAALAPVVEPVLDADQLTRDLYSGKASLPRVLETLQVGPGEVRALLERLEACDPPEPAPAVVVTPA